MKRLTLEQKRQNIENQNMPQHLPPLASLGFRISFLTLVLRPSHTIHNSQLIIIMITSTTCTSNNRRLNVNVCVCVCNSKQAFGGSNNRFIVDDEQQRQPIDVHGEKVKIIVKKNLKKYRLFCSTGWSIRGHTVERWKRMIYRDTCRNATILYYTTAILAKFGCRFFEFFYRVSLFLISARFSELIKLFRAILW